MSKLVKQLVMLQNLSKVSTYELRDSMPVNQLLIMGSKFKTKGRLYTNIRMFISRLEYTQQTMQVAARGIDYKVKPVIVVARIKCATG